MHILVKSALLIHICNIDRILRKCDSKIFLIFRLTQSDATLVSISVDNLLKAHCIPPQCKTAIIIIE